MRRIAAPFVMKRVIAGLALAGVALAGAAAPADAQGNTEFHPDNAYHVCKSKTTRDYEAEISGAGFMSCPMMYATLRAGYNRGFPKRMAITSPVTGGRYLMKRIERILRHDYISVIYTTRSTQGYEIYTQLRVAER